MPQSFAQPASTPEKPTIDPGRTAGREADLKVDAAARHSVREVLAGAVAALGGEERPGQIQMAEAVARAMEQHEHLLVQAGTGTGKSLGYLVPALLHDKRVVIATATLALQH